MEYKNGFGGRRVYHRAKATLEIAIAVERMAVSAGQRGAGSVIRRCEACMPRVAEDVAVASIKRRRAMWEEMEESQPPLPVAVLAAEYAVNQAYLRDSKEKNSVSKERVKCWKELIKYFHTLGMRIDPDMKQASAAEGKKLAEHWLTLAAVSVDHIDKFKVKE